MQLLNPYIKNSNQERGTQSQPTSMTSNISRIKNDAGTIDKLTKIVIENEFKMNNNWAFIVF